MKKVTYKNSYQRYTEVIGEREDPVIDDNQDDDNVIFVTDLLGKQHDLSGNIEKKLETVRKSIKHWEDKRDTERGQKFYDNMTYLYKQILLLMESNREAV